MRTERQWVLMCGIFDRGSFNPIAKISVQLCSTEFVHLNFSWGLKRSHVGLEEGEEEGKTRLGSHLLACEPANFSAASSAFSFGLLRPADFIVSSFISEKKSRHQSSLTVLERGIRNLFNTLNAKMWTSCFEAGGSGPFALCVHALDSGFA